MFHRVIILIALILVVTLCFKFYENPKQENPDNEKFKTIDQFDQTFDHNHHRFSTEAEQLPDGKYLIVGSRNNKVCRDDPNGIICNDDIPTSDDYFTIQNVDPSNKTYFIKGGRSDNWCGITSAGVSCNQWMTDDYCLFRIEPLKVQGKYGIKNVLKDKWCTESGYGLVCNEETIYGNDFQEFYFVPVREPNIR